MVEQTLNPQPQLLAMRVSKDADEGAKLDALQPVIEAGVGDVCAGAVAGDIVENQNSKHNSSQLFGDRPVGLL
jgi:hypothetical protein